MRMYRHYQYNTAFSKYLHNTFVYESDCTGLKASAQPTTPAFLNLHTRIRILRAWYQEDEIDVYLPNGQWIDLFTHERIKGGRWVKRKIELDKIPVFIRQNKMIPMLTKIPENIEEKYENLDVILFCEDEIRDTYIDDGNVQNLKAKIEEGTLFINTDMDASYFTVYAEKCLDNAVVNGQNWEIKKEKEGYYKIALEK